MITKKIILQDFKLKDEEVLTIFPYGSKVYGTDHYKSDSDFVIVMQAGAPENYTQASSWRKINVSIYDLPSFQNQIDQHKITALECLFVPKIKLLKDTVDFKLVINKSKLRKSISEKCSNSWVKAKKKFEVIADRDVYVAKKSLFHSLRIADFGIQLASTGKINNFSSCNLLWDEIYSNVADTWEPYKEKYQELFNSKMTEFRKLAPK